MIKDKIIDKIFNNVASDFNLTVEQIEDIHNSWGLFIRRTIMNIDFTKVVDKEEFDELKTNFNIPCIGKLYTNYKKLDYQRKQSQIRRNRNEFKEKN